MFPFASLRLTFAAAATVGLVVAAGCRQPRDASGTPPAADFLVTAGDSAFWVSTSDGRFRIRRAPLTVTNVAGRFYELYVADDDRSYYDALLIGQRIYRRDLLTGDSLQVFEDVRVNRIARGYAAAHPTERPLEEDEDGSDDPHTVATSEAELLDVVGPLLSFAHHIDIDIANTEDTHLVRHGIIDLRDGSSPSLQGVFGDTVARRIVAQGRAFYRVVIDSVRRANGVRGRRAARAIDSFHFDSSSFTIDEIDGAPMVGFFVPGIGESGGGLALPLPRVRAPEPVWWQDIAATVPRLGADSLSEIWKGPGYDVVARYDSTGDFATLVVRDSASHEWNAARLPTPARRVYRLDTPDVDSTAREALARAFDESTLYSGAARTVLGPPHRRPAIVLASWNARRTPPARGTSRLSHRRLDRD